MRSTFGSRRGSNRELYLKCGNIYLALTAPAKHIWIECKRRDWRLWHWHFILAYAPFQPISCWNGEKRLSANCGMSTQTNRGIDLEMCARVRISHSFVCRNNEYLFCACVSSARPLSKTITSSDIGSDKHRCIPSIRATSSAMQSSSVPAFSLHAFGRRATEIKSCALCMCELHPTDVSANI